MNHTPKPFAALISLAVAVLATSNPAFSESTEQAFVNVNVISMDPSESKRVKKRQTVLVRDGEIVEIGKASAIEIPEGAEIINGRKQYLLPGLTDMHAHGEEITLLPEDFSPQDLYWYYLANGVTTVFDPWGDKELFQWRKDIERGRVIGPRMFFTSPGVNDGNHSSADEVEASVRKWAAQGYDRIKTHSPISLGKFQRLHAVARELGLPVVGHAARPGFGIRTTLDEGQDMLAHIEEILSTAVDFNASHSFRQDLEAPLADIAASGIWVTTTVGTYEIITRTVDDREFEVLFERPEMRFFPPSLWNFWGDEQNRYRQDNFLQDSAFWAELLDIKLYIASTLVELGAADRLLLGTDSGIPLLLPGFGVHDELRLLVRGGMTPWEALRAGTYNAADFLGILSESGTVEVGKRGDLLLVKKNPLRKVSNLAKVSGVLVGGRWLPETELASELESLAERWEELEATAD